MEKNVVSFSFFSPSSFEKKFWKKKLKILNGVFFVEKKQNKLRFEEKNKTRFDRSVVTLRCVLLKLFIHYIILISVRRALQLRQSSDMWQWKIQPFWWHVTPDAWQWRSSSHFHSVYYGFGHYGAVFTDPRSQILTIGWVHTSTRKVSQKFIPKDSNEESGYVFFIFLP